MSIVTGGLTAPVKEGCEDSSPLVNHNQSLRQPPIYPLTTRSAVIATSVCSHMSIVNVNSAMFGSSF